MDFPGFNLWQIPFDLYLKCEIFVYKSPLRALDKKCTVKEGERAEIGRLEESEIVQRSKSKKSFKIFQN